MISKLPCFDTMIDFIKIGKKEKLNNDDWVHLLLEYPKFADECEWEKFEDHHWSWLYNHSQELREFIEKNKDQYLAINKIIRNN